MDDSTILPLDVFKIDRGNPGLTDPTYGLFQLPGGKFLVWSDTYTWQSYDSKEEAFLGYETLKLSPKGEVVSLDPKDYALEFRNNSNIDFTNPEPNNEPSTPNLRAEKAKTDANIGQDETRQQDRSETKIPNNNLPDNLQKDSTDDSPSPNSVDRADAEEPEIEYAGGSLLDDVERWIPSLFESAHKGVNDLKNELKNDVDENNWFGRAIGASALDVMDAAMSFTEGIPLGLLDTRRIGEGFAEGTWEGAKKDISRALNVLPQGRILRAVDRAVTVSDVVENLNTGDLRGVAMILGMTALAVASKGKKGNTKNRKSGQKKTTSASDPERIDDEFRRRHVSKEKLSEQQRQEYKRRVKNLHSGLCKGQGFKTTAITIVRDPKTGELITLVSSSDRRVPRPVRDKMRKGRNEVEARGGKKANPDSPYDHSNHAEVKAIEMATGNGLEIVEVFASRPACWKCRQMRGRLGIPITDPN